MSGKSKFASKGNGQYDYEFTIDELDADEEETKLDETLSLSVESESQEVGGLLKDPRVDRRRKSQRIALYAFAGFFAALFVGLIPLSWKNKDRASFTSGGSLQPLGKKNMIKCAGGDGTPITLEEWLSQNMDDISTLCDPQFLGESRKADPTRTTVKVFIMMGEANMVGAGLLHGGDDGTLEYTVYKKNRFTHLKSPNNDGWNRPRNDVRYVAVTDNFNVVENKWLQIDDDRGYVGPETQFGYVMGELFDEPVLIIKAAQGHCSLGGDLLPPESEPYELDGYVYPGYGGSPRRWEVGSTPIETSWHAGIKYDQHVSNIKKILRNIRTYYPGASTYEISG
jgi:hypothetical protein